MASARIQQHAHAAAEHNGTTRRAAIIPGINGDIFGPDQQALPERHDPLLRALAAAAADSDRWGVPRSAIDALAANGLLGRPLEPPSLQRELVERLFMADGSLAFCWLQHQMPLRRLLGAAVRPEAPAAARLRQRWLDPVASGRALAAVAFAHLRRPGPPNPVATRLPGGWRLEGALDWITSWDIADLALICVRCIDSSGDRVVGVLLPAGASGQPLPTGFSLGAPLRLLAMGGTHTRPARLDGVVVPDSMVLFVEEFPVWSAADRMAVCRVSPAVFGCMRGAITDLQAVGTARGDRQALALARTLAQQGRELRRGAYALMDDPSGTGREGQSRHRQLRAQALDLAMRCAQAALVAHAGAAMHSGSASERRLREAAFLLVQAQTADSRQASLELLACRNDSDGSADGAPWPSVLEASV